MDATVGAERSRVKEDGAGGSTTTRTTISLGAALNWELDIWGKVRKGVDAQEAEYQASEADWRAGYLTLVSQVGSAYFQIRQFDEQMETQRETIERNREILAMYQGMYQEGLVPNTQVLQQRLGELGRLVGWIENYLGAPRTGLIVVQHIRGRGHTFFFQYF